MVEANVKTIEELKSFLDTVAADAEIRRLVTQADSDLSRNRKLPLQRLVALIINLKAVCVLNCKSSLLLWATSRGRLPKGR